ncbi:hypothetical protein [Hydrogenophaga sp. NH-16]|uniref:hypothetical protein n=1 Tax=Hydrogenophaga sp. NH-16 TaxID=2184519 RepID=UPI000FD9C070|nr:hypothetical protein [Hydrogenophaga sp. NH-16]
MTEQRESLSAQPRFYFADLVGRRVLVTPWMMLANEDGLQELSDAHRQMPHYAAMHGRCPSRLPSDWPAKHRVAL